MDVEPQGGVVRNVVQTEPQLVWQPGINVPYQHPGEFTGLPNLATVEGFRDMVLPILKQYGHPHLQGRAPDTDVPHVNCWGREQQLPTERHCSLHHFRCAQPLGYGQHREWFLHLPVLCAPFNGSQDLCSIPHGAGAEG